MRSLSCLLLLFTVGVLPPPAQATDQAVLQARQYDQIRRSIRPEQKMRALKYGMEAVVQECLKERGYVRFRLTEAQRKTLAKFDRGTDERRRFLHGLASDAAVLEAQAVQTS